MYTSDTMASGSIINPVTCVHVDPVCMCPQSFSNVDLVEEEPVQPGPSGSAPQWRCYAKYLSSQQVLLTFLPTTLTGKKPPLHTHLYVMQSFSSRLGSKRV